VSQTLSSQLRLRELILSGQLAPGERLSEPSVAERLGASRTPVRATLVRLAEEGLVEVIPSGGFAVKSFTEQEIHDAIDLRGTLEGHAARLAAARRAPGLGSRGAPAGQSRLRNLRLFRCRRAERFRRVHPAPGRGQHHDRARLARRCAVRAGTCGEAPCRRVVTSSVAAPLPRGCRE
jgi:DNA-binding GntR family transcriptional regulator